MRPIPVVATLALVLLAHSASPTGSAAAEQRDAPVQPGIVLPPAPGARRVLVPGGRLVSAHISRFASACDGIQEGALRDATFAAIVDGDLTDGIHRNPTNRPEWFTTAYLHHPDDIRPEIEEAGFQFDSLIAVEGPGWMNQDLDAWLDDAAARERLLHVLRRVETEATLIGCSAHILAVAHR